MGKKPRKKFTPEVQEQLRIAGRRKYLRKKLLQGTASEAERRELEALGPGAKTGRPAQPQIEVVETGDVDSEAESGQDDAVATEAAAESPTTDGSAAVPPPAPRVAPPPAPRVEVAAKGSWRDRYRQGTGREGACREIAAAWCALLTRATKYIESAGQRPVFDQASIDKLIFPAAVLTADKFLPADFEMGSEIELTIYSGTIIGQAAMVARRQKLLKTPPPLRSVPFSAGRPPEPPPPEAERVSDNGVRSPEVAPTPPAQISGDPDDYLA